LLESARVDDLVYSKALASQIKSLACTGDEEAIDVLRGTLGGLRNQFPDLILQHSITWERLTNSRLFATASEAPGLIDFIMSPACPVSASLSNVDRGELVGVKQWWVEHAAR